MAFGFSWRDGLLRGSWRGVPFFCRDTGNPAGQRLAVFEFPDSDAVYVQSLGRGAKEYRLDIYVVGDDYMTMRDALEAALDSDGPGTLVHPYKGPLQVYARFPCMLRELADKGRAAFFECNFVEAGGAEPPSPTPDTAGQSLTVSQGIPALAAGSFTGTPVDTSTQPWANIAAPPAMPAPDIP
jgi:prophage DNA circulation protein